MHHFTKILTSSLVLAALGAQMTLGAVPTMPDVTQEMTSPSYWVKDLPAAGDTLAGEEALAAINQSCLDTPACWMTDFRNVSPYFREKNLYQSVWSSVYGDASNVLGYQHFTQNGEAVSGDALHVALGNVGGEDAGNWARTRYGIAVHRTDVLAIPSRFLATDEQDDPDYNYFQLSSVRVGEPVVVKLDSKDGQWYFCDTDCCSGWIPAEDVAICADEEEWLVAWDFPSEEAVVVNEGKFYLEASNTSPAVSELLVTMGTVLRRVSEEDFDHSAIKRMPYFNYAVWVPIRQEDGSYARTIALLSMNHFVSEGYLPLTTENILKVAFSKLGERYGWGNMLLASDCSGYVRDVYRCFGLIIPRNTTWQQAMPVYKIDVTEKTVEEKKQDLDRLPPGTILYFNGHEMLYLGEENGLYYVISCLSNVRDFDGGSSLKIGSVSVNTLDIHRMNGHTWMEDLTTLLVPYLTMEEGQSLLEPQEEETTAAETATEAVTLTEPLTETTTEAEPEAETEAVSAETPTETTTEAPLEIETIAAEEAILTDEVVIETF